MLESLISFRVFKNKKKLVSSINFARDAVDTSLSHIAGSRIVVNFVATVRVQVFHDIYRAFLINQRAYDHNMVSAEIEQL